VTLRTSVITASALFALALPAAAGAASTRADTTFRVAKETVSFHDSGQSRSVHKSHNSKPSKGSKAATGKGSKPAVYPVTYIFVPAPLGTSGPVADPNECQDSGSNCTDRQACDFWGMNCATAGEPGQAGVAPVDTPVAATTASTPAVQIPADAQVTSPSTITILGPSNCLDYVEFVRTGDPSYC
jgi:hypothetical protein